MAINYTQLFTILGKHVKHVNLIFSNLSALDGYQSDIQDAMDTAGTEDIIDDLPDLIDDQQDDLTTWITATMKGLTNVVLLDPTVVTDNLVFGTSLSVRMSLELLYDDMVANGEGINDAVWNESSYAFTETTQKSNALCVVMGNLLDGSSSPASGVTAFSSWNGVNTALVPDDLELRLTCTSDSESGGVARGSETFTIHGGVDNGSYSRLPEGAGQSQVTPLNNANLVPSGKFNSWLNGAPTGWTIVDGTAGTDFQESVSGLRGTSCLELIATKTCKLRIPVSKTLLTRRKNYVLSFAVKAATVPAQGLITATLYDAAGTIITATVDCPDDLSAATWVSSMDVITNNSFGSVPDELIDPVYLELEVIGAPDINVLVDDVIVAPTRWFGGVPLGLVVLEGKVLRDDMAARTVDYGETPFTTFFRKMYRFQLPMIGGGLETISDSLAS